MAQGFQLDRYAARPIAYFGHDATAREDLKCKRLIRKLGWAGYGRWWALCEVLAGCDGHFLPTHSDDDWEIVADYLDFPDVEQAQKFIEILQGLLLLEADPEHIWSKRMHKNAVSVGKKRKGGAEGIKKRWNSR